MSDAPESLQFTEQEAHALYELIAQLSGCNPENVFAWDGSDKLDDPTTSACVKLFRAAGKRTPFHKDSHS